MTRSAAPGSQSGQVVLAGVLALVVLGVSVGAGLYQVGAKSGLIQQKAAIATSSNVIKKALQAYVARNFRLPCPANGTLAEGSALDGVEQSVNGACTIMGSSGVVPWKTIGLSAADVLDGWRHRLGYAVTPTLASSTASPLPYQYLTISALTTKDAVQVANCVAACAAASKYAYVLISYGINGSGAYMVSGSRLTVPAGVSNEFANTLATAFSGATAFDVWPGNTAPTAANAYYDDTLIYETSGQLCKELNGSAPTSSSKPYCNPGNNTPADATQDTAETLGTTGGQMSNTGQKITAASSANSQSFVGCNSNSCSSATGKLTLNGGLGTVSLTDSGGTAQTITTGNTQLTSNYLDVVGGENTSNCSQCPDPNLNPGYLVPGQILEYNYNFAFTSFAMVNYLVDYGMTVKVTALSQASSSAPVTEVGELLLNNGYDATNASNMPCLGRGGSDTSVGAPDISPPWLQTLLDHAAGSGTIPAATSVNDYPPPKLAQQQPSVVVLGTTSMANYTNVRDYQFANRVFTDTDGTILKFNILQFQVEPYVDSNGTTDSSPYHFGMLFEGLKSCPTFASENITLSGTVTAGDIVNLNITNAATLGGTVLISYTVKATDTTLALVATGVRDAINTDSTLRGAQMSATNYDSTTQDFGSTIQLLAEANITTARNTIVVGTVGGAGTETITLSSGDGKLTTAPGLHLCDMRGAGVSPLYSDTATSIFPQDEWWNPPVNQTMDCSLQDERNLQ